MKKNSYKKVYNPHDRYAMVDKLLPGFVCYPHQCGATTPWPRGECHLVISSVRNKRGYIELLCMNMASGHLDVVVHDTFAVVFIYGGFNV